MCVGRFRTLFFPRISAGSHGDYVVKMSIYINNLSTPLRQLSMLVNMESRPQSFRVCPPIVLGRMDSQGSCISLFTVLVSSRRSRRNFRAVPSPGGGPRTSPCSSLDAALFVLLVNWLRYTLALVKTLYFVKKMRTKNKHCFVFVCLLYTSDAADE